MIHELRKWIRPQSLIILLAILLLNGVLFMRQAYYRDQALLSEYGSYQKLLAGKTVPDGAAPVAQNIYHTQQNHLDFYPRYIQEMPERAKEAYGLSPDGIDPYSERNIEKTQRDFEGLDQLHLSMGPDLSVTRPFDFIPSDLILLAMAVFLVTLLFTSEYEDHLFPLLLSTPSRAKVVLYKILLLGTTLLLLTLGMFGGNIIISGFIYGWDHAQRLVQSIEAFRSLAYPLTVRQFFLLALVLKWLNVMAMSLILFMLYTFFKKASSTLLLMGGGLGLSYLLYRVTAVNSIANAAHFLNPIYGMNSYDLIRQYRNINVFQYPFELIKLWPALCLAGILASIVVILWRFQRGSISHSRPSWAWAAGQWDQVRLRNSIRSTHHGLLLTELKKSLVSQKTGLIFLLLLALVSYRVSTAYRFMDSEQQAYHYFMKQFQGPITSETEERIEQAYEERLIAGSDPITDTELKALIRIQNQLDNMNKIRETSTIQPYLINDDSYAQWMEATKKDSIDIFIMFLGIVLMTAGIFAQENTIKITPLLRVTRSYRSLRRCKLLLVVFFSLVVSFLMLGARIIEFQKYDKLYCFQAPIQSHKGWDDFPFEWTMKQYFVVMIALRIATGIVVGLVTASISAYAKNESLAAALSTGLLVLPAILIPQRIPIAQYITLAWTAEANSLLHSSISLWVWGISFLVGLTILSLLSIQRIWQPQKGLSKPKSSLCA